DDDVHRSITLRLQGEAYTLRDLYRPAVAGNGFAGTEHLIACQCSGYLGVLKRGLLLQVKRLGSRGGAGELNTRVGATAGAGHYRGMDQAAQLRVDRRGDTLCAGIRRDDGIALVADNETVGTGVAGRIGRGVPGIGAHADCVSIVRSLLLLQAGRLAN